MISSYVWSGGVELGSSQSAKTEILVYCDHHPSTMSLVFLRKAPMTVPFKSACGIVMLLAFGGAAHATPLMLTGVTLYGGNVPDGRISTGGWNTVCAGVSKLHLDGYATCPMAPIDISAPGIYTFIMPAEGGMGDTYANLELFFDGELNMPGIHLVTVRDGVSHLDTTYPLDKACGLNYNCFVTDPTLSGISYASGSLVVTPAEFYVNNADWSGQFQIEVTDTVPEPGTLALLTTGGVLLLMRVRRRRAQA